MISSFAAATRAFQAKARHFGPPAFDAFQISMAVAFDFSSEMIVGDMLISVSFSAIDSMAIYNIRYPPHRIAASIPSMALDITLPLPSHYAHGHAPLQNTVNFYNFRDFHMSFIRYK